ncbi:MAG: hypothetical protein LUI85_18650 [Bacteroides sp.]|nr:hypothetical protein [Bacteroides sp.]
MKALIYLTISIISSIWLCSCRTKYVPVESVKTEIEYRDRLQRDSIHVHDSTFIYIKGDMVFRDRWHTEYKDRIQTDTLFIERMDSIQVPYPVERELSWWESIKQEIGGIAIGVIVALCFIIVRLIRKNRKR